MFKNINKNSAKPVNSKHFLMFVGLLIMLSACVKNTDLVGYTFKSENVDQIKSGETNLAAVQHILGSPSVTSSYGDKIWYYISTEYESMAFFKHKVKSQRVVAITFDKSDLVENIKEYSAKDAKEIKIISETTKAEGNDVGVLGQLLGNVGRFNSEPGKTKITKPKSVPQ